MPNFESIYKSSLKGIKRSLPAILLTTTLGLSACSYEVRFDSNPVKALPSDKVSSSWSSVNDQDTEQPQVSTRTPVTLSAKGKVRKALKKELNAIINQTDCAASVREGSENLFAKDENKIQTPASTLKPLIVFAALETASEKSSLEATKLTAERSVDGTSAPKPLISGEEYPILEVAKDAIRWSDNQASNT